MGGIRDYRVRIALDSQGCETMRLDLLMQAEAKASGPHAERVAIRLREDWDQLRRDNKR
jgi:hypothetical protein